LDIILSYFPKNTNAADNGDFRRRSQREAIMIFLLVSHLGGERISRKIFPKSRYVLYFFSPSSKIEKM
jgi:hypothetical protein